MVIKQANPRDKYNASCRTDMEQSDSASTATTYRKQFVDHQYQKQRTDINLCETSEGHQDHMYAKNVTIKQSFIVILITSLLHIPLNSGLSVSQSYNCTLTNHSNCCTALCICF